MQIGLKGRGKQLMGLIYKIQTAILRVIGDIQYYGWKHPFWFAFKPAGYKLKGEDYRIVKNIIQPGDILLQRWEGWIDKWFIPGFWNHAGIYVGGHKEQVVHAVSEGVLIEDLINFMRTDHLIILRAKKENVDKALEKVWNIIGSEYDFSFDFTNSRRFSCTEVIDYCFPEILERKSYFGRQTITPDSIAENAELVKIWDSREVVKTCRTRLIRRRNG